MNRHLYDVAVPNDWDRRGLPGWCYHSPALLDLEKEHVFRNHWQIICHVSDLPKEGDYVAMDVVGERALVVRGKDGVVRGFHNICRHRGSRVVADEKGTCRNALVCPFHGWVYNLDGTRRGAAGLVPRPRQDRVRPDAARPRNLDGADLRAVPLRSAAVGRRTARADRKRTRPLPAGRDGPVMGHLDPEDAGELEIGARRRQ